MKKLILAVTPEEEREAARESGQAGARLAHISYQMGTGPHLYRGGGPAAPKGGYMVLGDGSYGGGDAVDGFVSEVVRECAGRGFEGVILDFERLPDSLTFRVASLLAAALEKQGRRLCVPEAYADCGEHARVLIGSALSGGTLEARIREAAQRYGAERVVLAVERTAMDFYLPASDGLGRALTRQELRELIEARSPSIFFSQELCARYFTYMSNENGAHFILFDDASSVREKLRLAEELGVEEVLLDWREMREFWEEIFSGVRRGGFS